MRLLRSSDHERSPGETPPPGARDSLTSGVGGRGSIGADGADGLGRAGRAGRRGGCRSGRRGGSGQGRRGERRIVGIRVGRAASRSYWVSKADESGEQGAACAPFFCPSLHVAYILFSPHYPSRNFSILFFPFPCPVPVLHYSSPLIPRTPLRSPPEQRLVPSSCLPPRPSPDCTFPFLLNLQGSGTTYQTGLQTMRT